MKINIDTFQIVEKQYWDINYRGLESSISLVEATQKFKDLFYTSVKRRLRADVPVGSSLSGGLDSSLVVSVMDALDLEKQINRKTFSAQFPGFLKDESVFQQMVIAKTNVDPHFVMPTENSLLKNLEKIIFHQEEPFGSASIAVQYEVFGLAKQEGVTVLLDGQGADEVLAGYHGYFFPFFNEVQRLGKKEYDLQWNAYQNLHQHNVINRQDRQIRNWKSNIKSRVPIPIKNQINRFYRKFSRHRNIFDLHQDFAAAFQQPEFINRLDTNSLNAVLYHSTRVQGLEQLLRYADRNSMAHSREVRLPFLSHELVEFVFSLPALYKMNQGWTKYLMRLAFDDILPKEICWRVDKIGFEPPQQKWLQDNRMKDLLIHSVELLAQKQILDSHKADLIKNNKLSGLNPNLAWKYLMAGSLLR